MKTETILANANTKEPSHHVQSILKSNQYHNKSISKSGLTERGLTQAAQHNG